MSIRHLNERLKTQTQEIILIKNCPYNLLYRKIDMWKIDKQYVRYFNWIIVRKTNDLRHVLFLIRCSLIKKR